MSDSGIRLLSNVDLWRKIQHLVERARCVDAAIAYIGAGGADLLQLGSGHRIVVDMSLGAVAQGVTDPREVRKLLGRGVKVFSRSSLHAKVIVADKTLIASSANVSRNSRHVLDEAGVITTDPSAVRRALDFIDRLCVEPVRPKYLAECIKAYRPPRFKAATGPARPSSSRRKRVVQARLWFLAVGTLDLPDEELAPIERVQARAAKQLRKPEETEIDWVRYGRMPQFGAHLRAGDWVIECVRDVGRRTIFAPGQVLRWDKYRSPRGTQYDLLLIERPQRGEVMPLTEFRRRVRAIEPRLDRRNPRTRPIEDDENADAMMRMWTTSGRIAKHKRRLQQRGFS